MTTKKYNQPTKNEYETYFKNKYVIDENTGCYLWTAAKNNIGFGMFRYGDGMATAHRVAMALLDYDIKGKVVYHTCDNYHCVNPDHLRVGSNDDKAKQIVKKGRAGHILSDPKNFVTCEHCGSVNNVAVNGRWHGDRCKHKV